MAGLVKLRRGIGRWVEGCSGQPAASGSAVHLVECPKALRSLIEIRNKADGLIYSATKTLEEFAEDVDKADADALAAQIQITEGQLSGEDPEALEAALQELSRLSYGLTEKLYAALGGADEDLGTEDEA